MTNRRAKIAAGATVVGLAALGGVALGTNPGMPARSRSRVNGRRRPSSPAPAAPRPCRDQNLAAPRRGADRHPRQRRRDEPTPTKED